MASVDARIRARLDLVRQHMTDETANPLDGVSPLWNDAGALASALLAVLDLPTVTPATVRAIAKTFGIETP